ncbi:1-deoxy-D-xylulose-5-phosphate synthase [Ancylomarina euxinus]|uniref:1-deoxy-D-xylulose-5-phosphate synthase n=1 Tax=Ancylomarina euxinus TaxID=2283627 RepID=A0A425Y8G5_9BACT|nr:1-deoxy-D-xylulose-5-phosphate synthase [Ancylomarina euxinus]MCZ4693341.1 1-deoxy-D-xylulose-5-phosphate synthase [Ancylomarina euxinus]MUP13569.1 1-deoxy-D-xylulose-5-phosphate synthase [Ancylomarina euxinus]RRG24783.1 1-deoxy-D-xylulose-5-phosphate synthase [Ancylomarina euxinus]
MTKSEKPLLDQINFPSDLKKVSEDDLIQVCTELRQEIIEQVSCNPGHFGASLGVVELSVALHYVLNTPYDNLIWDVGHQAYGHKILTGRKDLFHTNRKYKGISGFPNRGESEYDAFTVGHSSTSISAALGMAVSAQLSDEKDRKTVAVIGDGSMTAGLAFEGLNNAATNNADILVILNDNNMAIDPNVGGMSEYLLDITTSQTYNKVKNDVWRFLGKFNRVNPNTQKLFQKVEHGIKTILLKQSNLFEALNFRYFGPVDGHNVNHMVKVLSDLQKIPGPKILHCITKKGKGFEPAELNQTYWHAPAEFNAQTGEILKKKSDSPQIPKFQDVFGHTLVELAEKNEKIVGITPAMPTGSSLNIMMEKMPDRAFDVGIAEQHAVTFSGGLAAKGKIPFCAIYSSFMQRAFDQVIHDVALQNVDVVFCLDRGGLVGADGATHHGVYDLAFFRCIPNMTISSPLNEEELRNLMYTAQLGGKGAFSIRYPRGTGRELNWRTPFKEIEIGKGQKLRVGKDLAILSIGPVGMQASDAIDELEKEGHSIAHYDMRFLKPIDKDLLHEVFKNHQNIITIEDGSIIGGLGSAVLEFMSDNDYSSRIKRLGVPDRWVEHGTQEELYRECGFDKEGIKVASQELLI